MNETAEKLNMEDRIKDITDLNVLFEAYKSSLRGSSWKREP